ncbi:MAG: hypothetical protein WAL27_04815, partial [Cellulosimicrobium cellulans]
PEFLEKAGKWPPACALRHLPAAAPCRKIRGLLQWDPYLTDQQKAANTIMMCCVHAAETKNWSWTFEYHH